MIQTAVLQLHHRESFERNVTRALAFGAGAGVVQGLCSKAGLFLPLEYLTTAAAALACVRGDRMDRVLLIGLSLLCTGAPWLFGLSAGWTVLLSGAAAGAVMVRAQLCERGDEGQVAHTRPGPLNFGLSAVICGLLAFAGLTVVQILSARMVDLSTPWVLASALRGAASCLFVALGSIAAHLALQPDPVESRCEELIPRLRGELQTLASRLLTQYRQCGRSLSQLPREPAREELARTLALLTQDAVELASDWAEVEAQLEEHASGTLLAQVTDLQKSAQGAKDPVARRQLEMAAQALQEECDRLGELALRRERIVAKLKSQVALLDRARISLVGLRSGQAQVKAAELSAMARKLEALAQTQTTEGALAHAVATHSELSQVELAQVQAVATHPPSPRPENDTRPQGEPLRTHRS